MLKAMVHIQQLNMPTQKVLVLMLLDLDHMLKVMLPMQMVSMLMLKATIVQQNLLHHMLKVNELRPQDNHHMLKVFQIMPVELDLMLKVMVLMQMEYHHIHKVFQLMLTEKDHLLQEAIQQHNLISLLHLEFQLMLMELALYQKETIHHLMENSHIQVVLALQQGDLTLLLMVSILYLRTIQKLDMAHITDHIIPLMVSQQKTMMLIRFLMNLQELATDIYLVDIQKVKQMQPLVHIFMTLVTKQFSPQVMVEQEILQKDQIHYILKKMELMPANM